MQSARKDCCFDQKCDKVVADKTEQCILRDALLFSGKYYQKKAER